MKTIHYLYHAGSDIYLDCELEYDPGEPPNRDPESPTCGPGCAPAAYLMTANNIGKIDIMPILDPKIIKQIEVAACSSQD
jgi:hypothetical protein